MTLLDAFLLIIYFLIAVGIGKFYSKSKGATQPIYNRWFMKGLVVKLLGGVSFAMVYTFYYEYGGDTMSYFEFSKAITEHIIHYPAETLKLLTRTRHDVSSELLNAIVEAGHRAPKEYYVVNIAGIINLFTFKSYYSTTIVLSFLSFLGVWQLFLLLVKYYPQLEKQMAIAVFFIPSVVLWGSGLMKDTIIIGLLGVFIYRVDKLIASRFTSVPSMLWILIAGYLMLVIKAYVLFSIVPAILLWRVLYLRDRIKNEFIKAAFLPFALALGFFTVVVSVQQLGKYNKQYAADQFMATAETMQDWHYKAGANTASLHGRGSSYTLGNYQPTMRGLISVFPEAVNVTLFRPYLWEANNAGMLGAALESLVLLLFSVRVLFMVNPFRVLGYAAKDSFLMMCLLFSIFFAFAVGFSSYNFGALVRYKIPCIPFYLAALFILRERVKAAGRKTKQGKRKTVGARPSHPMSGKAYP